MTVMAHMKEYSVELDDIRWYLSYKTAERLLTYNEDLPALTKLVWSGKLESDLYDMEEGFVHDLQDRLDRGLADEMHARELFAEVSAAKKLRESYRD